MIKMLKRLILAYALASYPVVLVGVLAIRFEIRKAEDLAELAAGIALAPWTVFFFLFVYGLPRIVVPLWHQPTRLLTEPKALIPYVLLGVCWTAVYLATPFLARWYRA